MFVEPFKERNLLVISTPNSAQNYVWDLFSFFIDIRVKSLIETVISIHTIFKLYSKRYILYQNSI